MKNLIKPIVLFSLASFVSVSSATTINAIADDAYEKHAFNGAVLVIDGNKEQFKSVYGFESGSRTAPLTLEHRFSIGSISKEFPAAVIHQLVTEKKITLKQPFTDFIPALPAWSKTITIEHLLNYTSGLPDFPWQENINDQDMMTVATAIESLNSLPGQKYHYSYYNNFLLAKIIEAVTKKEFNQVLTERVFIPNMMKSAVNTLNPPQDGLAIALAFNKNFKNDHFPVAVTGPGVYLTIEDLGRWGRELFKAEALLTNFAKPPLNSLYKNCFGKTQSPFGNVKFFDGRATEIFHDGSHLNFHSIFYVDRTKQRIIIVLSNNKANNDIFSLRSKILELLNKYDDN